MRRIVTTIIFCMFSVFSYAQFDNNMMQMFNQAIQYGNDAIKQQKEQYEKILEEARKKMTISAAILPSSRADVYRALIMVSTTSGINDLIVEYSSVEASAEYRRIDISNCVVIAQYVWLPEVFKPGNTLRIKKRGQDQELFIETIPQKESSNYASFKRRSQETQSRLAAAFGGNNSYPSYSVSNSSNSVNPKSSQGQSVCSMCNGTGEVVASTASYVGGTKWCSKCNKEVTEGHYHNTCSSCSGKGYR